MKRKSLIAVLAAVMILASTAVCFAADGLKLVSSYPEDGQKNTSIENLGVKLQFSNDVNSKDAKAVNEKAVKLVDEDGTTVPTKVLFDDEDGGLVLVVADLDGKNYTVKNNSEYICTISGSFVDNEGNTLGKDTTVSFKTYNQKLNNAVNMGMMFVMFGGIMLISLRQNQKKEEETEVPKETINPYKEAKRTGKSVEQVKAEIEKKAAKEAKKRARKAADNDEPVYGKIENCAEYLNNVYHVHAPAPVNHADRSIEAIRRMRRDEKKAAKAAQAAATKKTRKK